MPDFGAQRRVLTDQFQFYRISLVGSARDYPITPRRDIANHEAAIGFRRDFEKLQHVVSVFTFGGRQIDMDVLRQLLAFGSGDATAQVRATFGDHDRETGYFGARSYVEAIASNVRVRTRRCRKLWLRLAQVDCPDIPTCAGQVRIHTICSGDQITKNDFTLIVRWNFNQQELELEPKLQALRWFCLSSVADQDHGER